MNERSIEHRVVAITGATSGIGLATARHLADRGARLALFARDEEALAEVARELTERGAETVALAGDVADREALEQLANLAEERFGLIDVWINNAGVSIYGRITRTPVEDQRRLFETNYWGTVNGSLVAVSRMRGRGGHLINVGSVLSDLSVPIQGPYCASKHAVKGFTDALRMEVEAEEANVDVTLIKPASIATPYNEHARNLTHEASRNPPPVYAPGVVARAIVRAIEHPQRDVYVGGGGRLMSLFGQLLPRTADRAMRESMITLQQGTAPRRLRGENLYDPPGDEPRESAEYPEPVLERSLYTAIVTRPLVKLGLGAAAAVVLGMTALRT